MFKNKIKLATLRLFNAVLIVALLGSCTKEEGFGGNSSIVGYLKTKVYNEDFSQKIEEHYTADEYVYIIFGEDEGYSERVKTNYDGAFVFKYLKKGNYKVFAYSKDKANPQDNSVLAKIKEINISESKSIVYSDDIIIDDNLPKEKGQATITGKVFVKKTKNGKVVAEYYGMDERVYLVFGDEINYQDQVKTNYNGEFQFKGLNIGTYTLYCYSKDIDNQSPSGEVVVKMTVTIKKATDKKVIPDLEIYQ